MVIFGGAGDLAKRLLVPALYNLAQSKLLDDGFKVLGADHNPGDDAKFRDDLEAFVKTLASDKASEFGAHHIDAATLDWLGERLLYQVTDFTDPKSFTQLAGRLEKIAGQAASVVF